MLSESCRSRSARRQGRRAVVHQREPKSFERRAALVTRQQVDLLIGQPQLARIVVIARQPGRVEPNDVYGKGELSYAHTGPVAQASEWTCGGQQRCPSEIAIDPAPKTTGAGSNRFATSVAQRPSIHSQSPFRGETTVHKRGPTVKSKSRRPRPDGYSSQQGLYELIVDGKFCGGTTPRDAEYSVGACAS
jgi:hypothetical protein